MVSFAKTNPDVSLVAYTYVAFYGLKGHLVGCNLATHDFADEQTKIFGDDGNSRRRSLRVETDVVPRAVSPIGQTDPTP